MLMMEEESHLEARYVLNDFLRCGFDWFQIGIVETNEMESRAEDTAMAE